MARTGLLGSLEEMVLLALVHLEPDAYAVPVRRLLEERMARSVTMGAVYGTLDRLEEKGLVESRTAHGDEVRRGRPRRFFAPLPAGLEALRQSSDLRASMWQGLERLESGGVGVLRSGESSP